jgi:hypothetical protein
MNKNKYLKELLDGSGHLNKYPVKSNDKAPDYGGYVKIDNKIYRISAWVKFKNEKKFLSIRVHDLEYNSESNEI